MDYYISQRDNYFTIKKENIPGAHKALIDLAKNTKHLSWIINDVVIKSKDFEAAINECRYEITMDEDGNVGAIYFNGEKHGDEEAVLEAIAPFVEEDSWISFNGEDGEMWRYYFYDGGMTEQCPDIVWPKSPIS